MEFYSKSKALEDTSFAADEDTELVCIPWYYVQSVADDGVTLTMGSNVVFEDVDKIEESHNMIVALKSTENGITKYTVVSGAKSESKALNILERKYEKNYTGGKFTTITYQLNPEKLGKFTISYGKLKKDIEVILPGIGFYSKPEAKAKKKITVKWNKAENANKYQIAISRSKSFKSGVAIYTADANTIKKAIKLKKSGKYFVKVRAYHDFSEGIYGAWSKVKSVKVKA